MLIENMVESSVILTGPRSVTTIKPIDLISLNNNNNESDNEKQEVNNGHLIKDDDTSVKLSQQIDNGDSGFEHKVEVEDTKEDKDENAEEEEDDDEFESLDGDEEEVTTSSDEEDDGQFTPETESDTCIGRIGVIPDVLLNELHEILVSSTQVGEVLSDDENGESWSSSSSDSSNSASPSPVLVLEAIPEEEEDWDSDSTLTELSASAGHARYPPLSDVSTQPPPLNQPSSVLPGSIQPSVAEDYQEKGPRQQGPLTSLSPCSTSTSTNIPTPLSPEATFKTPPENTSTREGDSANESGSLGSSHSKKSVKFLEDHICVKDSEASSGGGESLLSKSLLDPQEKEQLNLIETHGPTSEHLQKFEALIPSSQEQVQSVRNETSKSTYRRKCVTFKDFPPCSRNGDSSKSASSEVIERGGSGSSAGVEGERVLALGLAPLLTVSAPSSGPASEYFVVKLLAAEQQRQLDLVDLTRLATYDSGRELSKFIEASTAGSYFSDNNNSDSATTGEMHQRLSSSCSEHQHLPPVPREKPRSVLRKVGASVKRSGRNVSFNESLNLFYEAECQCWIHEDDYARLRHEEQMQQQLYEQATQLHQLHHHHHHHHTPYLMYEPPPLEFEDTPTLSPPEGYKDRFFPQMEQLQLQQQQSSQDPDVTRVSPPSPPAARRKVFLKENSTEQQPVNHTHHRPVLNGLEEEEEEERAKKSSRFGGILKGGRLWRSNSSDSKKASSPDEPDLVKCTEKNDRGSDAENVAPTNYPTQQNQSQQVEMDEVMIGHRPTQVSIGTAPLRTSEQIRLAVDSTLRISRSKKNKQECSSLVEKLRWLTSLDDDDSSDSQSGNGFATWPSRDKNGVPNTATPPSSSSRKSDAGTSTEEFVHPNLAMRHPISSNEAKIKQISYTLEDIDEGLKGGENELETFITEDGGRLERIRRRYGEDVGGDDYGFSRRPSVKGIKPKFSSTNQIFAQFTRAGAETPIPQMQMQMESQYENTRTPNSNYEALPPNGGLGVGVGEGGSGSSGARVNLNYDQFLSNPAPPTSTGNGNGNGSNTNSTAQPSVRPGISSNEESRSHFEMIRQSFEQASFVNYNRPHSWSVSTLPHNHSHPIVPISTGHIPLPGMANNLSASALNIQGQAGPQGQPQQPQNNLSMGLPVGMNGATSTAVGGVRPNSMPMMGPQQQQQLYGTLPSQQSMMMAQQQQGPGGQPIYGTVRRVPNVIGRPLFLHYGALSVEAHPNKLVQPYPPTKIPETPSPTQPQQLPAAINNIKYYGPPIRYYNPPPPVPPRSATTSIGSGNGTLSNMDCIGLERGNPEGATDEEPSIKEPYSMNV